MQLWPRSAFQSPKGHATSLDPFSYFLVPEFVIGCFAA